MDFVNDLLSTWGIMLLWLGGLFVAFGILSKLMPCNPAQPLWRKDSLTDLCYYFIMPVFTRFVRIFFLASGAYIIFHGETGENMARYFAHGFGPLSKLPIWLQAAAIFLISDVILYWTHRLYHSKNLWKYHAIHHSSPEVDWLSAYRFHPINIWTTFTLVDALTLLVGFSPEAISALAIFNMLYSGMVHSNLSWTFGPFKYLFASPAFHRWHHTAQEEGMDKNFAPTFPLLDIAFGTFYMPEGRLPERYGAPGSNVPDSFWGQLAHPFKKK